MNAMSILTLRARPIVAFDANNPKHREEYYRYTVKHTWGYSPVRFMADDGANNLASHVSIKMLEYYVNKEFKNKKVKK
jgi:hypothetical protein